jgi:O-antigen ligase
MMALGDGILALMLLTALLLPAGMPAADSPVKGALQIGFALLVCAVLAALLGAQRRLPRLALALAACMLPYALVLAARGGYLYLGYLAAIAALILVSASARYGSGFWRVSVLASGLLACVYLALWLSEGSPMQFRGWMVNKNYLGSQLLFMAILAACAMKFLREPLERFLGFGVLLALALLLVVSSSRASLLAAGGFFLAYAIWPLLARRPAVLKGVFLVSLALSILVIPLYIALWLSPLAPYLDQWSLSLTGQLFFSGRQYVWPVYLLVVAEAPLFGHGFAFDRIIDPALWEGLPDYYTELSAHNLYLMVALQTGLAGLAAFCVFIVGIWNLLAREPARPAARIAGAAFLAFLLHEIFEVSLTQNNLIAAWPIWMLVGLALSEAHERAG